MITIKEDGEDPNVYTLIGPRSPPDRVGESWVASIRINGEFTKAAALRMVRDMASALDPQPLAEAEARGNARGIERAALYLLRLHPSYQGVADALRAFRDLPERPDEGVMPRKGTGS